MQMLIGLAYLTSEATNTSLRKCAAIGLYFRGDPYAVKEKALTIRDILSVGQKSDTCLLRGGTTRWFDLDPIKKKRPTGILM